VTNAQVVVDSETGRFGANMQISPNNDGPVTFLLRANPPA